MHTLNLRLHPDELAYIANHARDRFLIVDDVLLPLYESFRNKVPFERVFCVPFGGAAAPEGMEDYETFSRGDGRRLRLSARLTKTKPRRCVLLREPRENRREWSIRIERRCCTVWGYASPTVLRVSNQRHGPARVVDVSCKWLGRALCSCNDGRKACVSGAAPRRGESARTDTEREGHGCDGSADGVVRPVGAR